MNQKTPYTLMITALLVSCLVSCLDPSEILPQLEPLTEEDVVGIYIPSHSGIEVLQVLPHHVWIRTYYYPDATVAVDTGTWKYYPYPDNINMIKLDGHFFRYEAWAKSSRPRDERSGPLDPVLLRPGMHSCNIKSSNGRIWIDASREGIDRLYRKQ